MKITDSDANDLKIEEHKLIRALDKNEITQEKFDEEIKPLREKIIEKVKILIDKFSTDNQPMEVNTMAEKVKQEGKVQGIKTKKNSLNSAIADVLGRKSIKNIDQAVVALKELKPELTDIKAKNKIKTMIRETTQGKGRWKNFTWDEKSFQMSPKV